MSELETGEIFFGESYAVSSSFLNYKIAVLRRPFWGLINMYLLDFGGYNGLASPSLINWKDEWLAG